MVQVRNLTATWPRYYSNSKIGISTICFGPFRHSFIHLFVVIIYVFLDKNESDAMGRTPLHTATEHGHEAVVKYLLAQGADKDKVDLVGYTPLQSASQYNQDALKGTSNLYFVYF